MDKEYIREALGLIKTVLGHYTHPSIQAIYKNKGNAKLLAERSQQGIAAANMALKELGK